jgi:hypothetical protein
MATRSRGAVPVEEKNTALLPSIFRNHPAHRRIPGAHECRPGALPSCRRRVHSQSQQITRTSPTSDLRKGQNVLNIAQVRPSCPGQRAVAQAETPDSPRSARGAREPVRRRARADATARRACSCCPDAGRGRRDRTRTDTQGAQRARSRSRPTSDWRPERAGAQRRRLAPSELFVLTRGRSLNGYWESAPGRFPMRDPCPLPSKHVANRGRCTGKNG